MKKAPLFAIATAAVLLAGAGPALAGDRDHVSFSFGVILNDGGHRGPPPGYYERERVIEREPCDDDYGYRPTYYGRPYGYGPPRVVVVEREYRHGHRHRHWHDRDWD